MLSSEESLAARVETTAMSKAGRREQHSQRDDRRRHGDGGWQREQRRFDDTRSDEEHWVQGWFIGITAAGRTIV